MSKNKWPQLYPTQQFSRVLEKGLRGIERIPWAKKWLAPYQHIEPSSEELTLVVTLHPKDLWIAKYALSFAIKNVLHPIQEVLVISPPSSEVSKWAEGAGYSWYDENEMPVISLDSIREALPAHAANRDTWIYQQLLKLAADDLIKTDAYLVLDADTLLLKPRVFKRGGERWLDFSHERNLLYLKSYRDLLNLEPRSWPSYVCHHLFVEKPLLTGLKRKIEEEVGLPWAEAIVAVAGKDIWNEKEKVISPFNFFSEYETYSNWVISKCDNISFQYFRNHAARNFDPEILDVESYVDNLPSFYQWASFHSYYKIS